VLAAGVLAVLLLLGIGGYGLSVLLRSSPPATQSGDNVAQAPAPAPDTRPKLELVPRQLVVRHKVDQEHPVTFSFDMKFESKDAKDEQHTCTGTCAVHYREITKQVSDEDRNPAVRRLEYQDCKLEILVDNKKDRFKFSGQEEVVNNIARMASLQRLSWRENRLINYEIDLGKEIDDPNLKQSYVGMHGQLTTLLGFLHVPNPPGGEKPVKPGDTWSESGEFSRSSGSKGEVHTSTNRFTYTYEGLRRTNGREEAVIRVKVELRARGDESLSGDGDGEAIFDLKAGQVSTVKLKVDLKTDTSLFVVDGDSRATGTIKLELQRDVSGGQ
jgi:hypothetical protein